MNRKNTKILYTYLDRRSFVSSDLKLLGEHFSITPYPFTSQPKWKIPLECIKQFLFILFRIRKTDYLVSFFAGYHTIWPTLFARWFGKTSFIFLGGTECFKYPSFHYGNFTKKLYGRVTCYSAHKASLLIPVSSNLIRSYSDYYDKDSPDQGIYHWCSQLHTPFRVIPLEYNPDVFKSIPTNSRTPNSFITVAFGIQGTAYIRKGIDKFIWLAARFPKCTFTVIGCRKEDFPSTIPDNVNVIGPVPYEDLVLFYNAHQYYIQLSIAEGFPSAICEAMLCQCIPIGSTVGAIPDIVGDCGYLVEKRDDQEIEATVVKALQADDKEETSRKARERIITKFGPGSRKEALLQLFS
jgi:glycosyltransferase involved in cell wall biosynthesis